MFFVVTIYCTILVYNTECTMQEKWARSLEFLIGHGSRGATAGSVSNRGLEGEGTREGSGGRTQDHDACHFSVLRLEVVIGCHSLILVFNR